ncbi:molybdenum cofactor guanylyltransferase [Cognatitamlana onchidii]|uniref:molybdenum cofactor guanylyltransferase n=1 Tax=Cognatitamlana onchidii TaxID=2562860 RepID=UPI0010A60625|nr:molybdenum cofactor guanylyltransferase [Algibacter onchidii]
MIEKKNITGIILAGGKSSRMGSDKGFLELNNKLFVAYSIDALTPLVSEIIIVSDHSTYDSLGYKRVTDCIKEAGPVSGIYSGLEASKTKYNLVLSCDIPLISSEVLQKLIEAIDDTTEIIQAESQGKSMPLVGLYKKQVKETFYQYLQKDERRLRVVIKNCAYKNVVLNKTLEHTTINVNTKEEFKQITNGSNP